VIAGSAAADLTVTVYPDPNDWNQDDPNILNPTGLSGTSPASWSSQGPQLDANDVTLWGDKNLEVDIELEFYASVSWTGDAYAEGAGSATIQDVLRED